jgi:hypothetical protein
MNALTKRLALLAILLTLAAGAPAQVTSLQDLLPRPDIENGWRYDVEPASYTADNLFEYIDGEAELYIDYHFAGMASAAYIQGDNMEMTYTVDISDMGSPLDAFGLYSSHRSPNLHYAEIGEEATVSELNVRFFKDRYFVQLNAGSFKKGLYELMLSAACKLAENLPAAPAPAPHELTLLPRQNQLPHSLKYVTKGFLGQSAFPAGLIAHYAAKGDTLQAFIVLTTTTEQSLPAFAAFAASLKERGTLLEQTSSRIEVEMPHQGRILAQHHLHWIAGVIGHKETKTAEILLADLLSNLGE